MYGNRRKDRLCNLARVANRNTGAHRRLRCHSRCQEAPSLSFERLLRKESQLGMPQLAAALSITNMMNPHLFFSSSLWKPRTGDFLVRHHQLGGVAATELKQEIRKDGLERKKEEVRRGRPRARGGPRRKRRGQARSTPSYREVASVADFSSSWMSQPLRRQPPQLQT